jgi:hypothetical protein
MWLDGGVFEGTRGSVRVCSPSGRLIAGVGPSAGFLPVQSPHVGRVKPFLLSIYKIKLLFREQGLARKSAVGHQPPFLNSGISAVLNLAFWLFMILLSLKMSLFGVH